MQRWRARWKQRPLFLSACLLMPLMLRWFEHSQVYHPDRIFQATGRELGAGPLKTCCFEAVMALN